MPTCIIDGCNSRSGRDKVGFYGIPSVIRNQCEKTLELSARRRTLWVARINRPNFGEENISRDTRVCSKHFLGGKPSGLFDDHNVDWIPNINLGYSTVRVVVTQEHSKRARSRPSKGKDNMLEVPPKKMREEVQHTFASSDETGDGVSVCVEIVERDFVEGEESACGLIKEESATAVSTESSASETESTTADSKG